MNQRLILCIVVIIKSDSIKLYFQNITQMYVCYEFIRGRTLSLEYDAQISLSSIRAVRMNILFEHSEQMLEMLEMLEILN